MSGSESGGSPPSQNSDYGNMINDPEYQTFLKSSDYAPYANPKFAPWASGSDFTSITNSFKAWKQRQDMEKATHDQYVQLTQDNPGRNATILTPPGQTKPVTLIGG